MSTASLGMSTAQTRHGRSFGMCSLVDMVTRIVRQGDQQALHELHEHRTVFQFGADRRLLFVGFVNRLHGSFVAREWCGGSAAVLDAAHGLTVDKFSRLPVQAAGGASRQSQDRSLKQGGVDCRYYFSAFLDYVERRTDSSASGSRIKQEAVAARLLQTHVYRHFLLSCLECARRARQLVKRYAWKLNGVAINLWFPTEMSGREITAWLCANVNDPDPSRPGERERVQAIVDGQMVRRTFVSLSDVGELASCSDTAHPTLPWSLLHGMSVEGLAEQVAEEKADNLSLQRPAIQALGRETLRQMILRIFHELSSGEYRDGQVAEAFGLSKSTLSRFAGSRWAERHKAPNGWAIPDLWRNTARTLASRPSFVAAAQEAGVWHRVRAVHPDRPQEDEQ